MRRSAGAFLEVCCTKGTEPWFCGIVDLIAAHKWFNLAALKGRVDAVAMRREVAEQMSDADIAAAQREARAWMATH